MLSCLQTLCCDFPEELRSHATDPSPQPCLAYFKDGENIDFGPVLQRMISTTPPGAEWILPCHLLCCRLPELPSLSCWDLESSLTQLTGLQSSQLGDKKQRLFLNHPSQGHFFYRSIQNRHNQEDCDGIREVKCLFTNHLA